MDQGAREAVHLERWSTPPVAIAGEFMTIERRREFERELAHIRGLLVDCEIDRLRVSEPIVPKVVLPDGYVSCCLGALSRLRSVTDDRRARW